LGINFLVALPIVSVGFASSSRGSSFLVLKNRLCDRFCNF